MKIIVDMMGGDNAPLAVLEGAAQAVKEYGVQLIGVGNEALVRKTAAEHNIPLDGIELVNCTETIEMCDEPARAVRQKKDSSIVVGLNMLKEGKGDAFVSAGSTGALHVGASLIVRTLRGVKRPALATMVPAKQQAYLLLDCGANVECRPEMLAAFAVMGSCYVNKVEGRKNPSVALANNGAEESKGTPVLRDAHQLLKTTPGIRFVGNIEPRDVPNGEVDVVVCDGFTGNVLLKGIEGSIKYMTRQLKGIFMKNFKTKLAALAIKDEFKALKASLDPNEVGGKEAFIRQNWLGGRTADCVGLIKGYGWLDAESEEIIYNTNGMPDITANEMFHAASVSGTIDTIPETPGLAVWHDGHIGVYIGNGEVVEAMGTRYGVVKTKLEGARWTHWLKIPYISYD